MSLTKIISQIKKKNSFLISSHVNLEGDALGSELAFYRLVKALGKDAVVVNEDELPYGYDYLPEVNNIIKYRDNMKTIEFDCFAALDCSDLKRTGEVYRLNSEGKTIINIDHHISNVKFGTVNWVDPGASCASEMVYELYKKLGVKIDRESAMLLYTGILADTGSFRYANTTSRTHKIVAELLKFDLNVSEIYRNVFGNVPFADMKLIAGILNDIRRQHQGKLVWFEVRARVLKKYNKIVADLTDHVLGFGRAIKDVEVVVLFKENLGVNKEVRINFRSQGKVDVNQIAGFFGGGGHKAASGCTVRGNIEDVRKKVLRKIEQALDEQGL